MKPAERKVMEAVERGELEATGHLAAAVEKHPIVRLNPYEVVILQGFDRISTERSSSGFGVGLIPWRGSHDYFSRIVGFPDQLARRAADIVRSVDVAEVTAAREKSANA